MGCNNFSETRMPSQIVLDKYVEFLANNPRVDSQKLRDIIRSVGLHYGLSGNRNIVRVFANLVLDESLDELTRWFAYTYMHEVYATPTTGGWGAGCLGRLCDFAGKNAVIAGVAKVDRTRLIAPVIRAGAMSTGSNGKLASAPATLH